LFYICTFTSGMTAPVVRFLQQDVENLSVIQQFDGMVEVYTPNREQLLKCAYLNHVFLLLSRFGGRGAQPERMVRSVLAARRIQTEEGELPKAPTFRILCSDEGVLTPIPAELLGKLEERVSEEFGMKADRGRPKMEMWFMSRREGVGYFLARLTRHAAYDRVLRRGEMRPDLAALLCRTAGRSTKMLDPFAGSGAIAEAWAKLYGGEVFAGDTDAAQVAQMKRRFQQSRSKASVEIKKENFFNEATGWPRESYPRVVTEPPWRLYGEEDDLQGFYRAFMERLCDVLAPGGAAVVLTGAREEMEVALQTQLRALGLDARYDILVNGKKASVYRLVRSKRL